MKRPVRRPSTPSLLESAVRVARVLGRDSCALIGGLAVAAYGHERATRDVDFMSRLPLHEARRRLQEAGLTVEVRHGDPEEGVPTFLRSTVRGMAIDVLPMLVAVDWEHLPEVPLGASAIKVVDLDALLHLKARAGGVQDMLDVAQLVWRHPDRLPLARDLAGRYGVGPKLEACLRDRRERQRYVDALPREKRLRAATDLRRLIDDGTG